ncbi:hypothetical protein ACF1HJ_23645 [Streptomyces sp. NPDC013978]|uniref:hypothetical protein n=1 Tax=Streptomyces sp. NPDC013978 TaxID=3364869 RepID=UPI0036FFC0E4
MGRTVRLRLRRVLLRHVRLLTVRLRLGLWLRMRMRRVRLLAVRPLVRRLVRRLLTVGPLG